MDTFLCGHCKREENVEDAAGSGVCTCTYCGALLQVPSLQVLYRSATPPLAQVLEAPKSRSPSVPPAKLPGHMSGTAENRASEHGLVSSRPVSHQPRSAARQSVDRRLQEEMEAYQPKATHSLSRDSLFANTPPSPVGGTRVKTVDISGGSILLAPPGGEEKTRVVSEISDLLASPEGKEKTRLTSPETTSVSLSFGPKLYPPPGSTRASTPPSAQETSGADVMQTPAGAQGAVSAAGSPNRGLVGAVPGAGAVSHRRFPSTDSDGSSASTRRLRAFSAKAVTESDLPPGVNVYVAQPYVLDESEEDAPEFWAKPADPPFGSQANYPPGTNVFVAQPYAPGEDEGEAPGAKPADSQPPPEPRSEPAPSTKFHETQPYTLKQVTDKPQEVGPAASATPVGRQGNRPPETNVYVAQTYVANDETSEAWAKAATPDPGFQANRDPWSELGAEKVWEGDVLRVSGDRVAKATSRDEPSNHPTGVLSAAVRSANPAERNPQLEDPIAPTIFEKPHPPPEKDRLFGAERVEHVVPQTLRRVNIGRSSGGEDSGVPTTPPKGSGAPPASPTFQRAMLEYHEKMKSLFGGKSKADAPRGGPETAAPDRGGSEAEEEAGSDQEVFEEIDLDDGGGSKEEMEGGGFKSGLKKWASGVEGLLWGVSGGSKSFDKLTGASHGQENSRGGGVPEAAGSGGQEEERAVDSNSLAAAEEESVGKVGEDQTTIKEESSVKGMGGGAEIVVPKGVEIAIGESPASGDAPAPVRRAISEPVDAERGGPGSSSFRGVGRDVSLGDSTRGKKSFPQLGTGANSANGLVGSGGSGSGSFRGGAEVGRSGNYGSASSFGGWSDDSESDVIRTVERVQLEEGGYVIRAVMKRVPRSGRSSPHLAGSRGTSPEPTGEGLRSDVALAEEGLRSDVAPAEEGLRSDVASAEEGLRSDVASAEEGLRGDVASAEKDVWSDVASAGEGSQSDVASAEKDVRSDVASAEEGLRSDVAPAGEGVRSDVTPSGQGLGASTGKEGLPRGAGEDWKDRWQSTGAARDHLEIRKGPEPSARIQQGDRMFGVSRDRERSEVNVGAAASVDVSSRVAESSSSEEKRLERKESSGGVNGPGEGAESLREGVLPSRGGVTANREGVEVNETRKAESLLPATVSRNGSLDRAAVPGGSQPASKTGTLIDDAPPETWAERATGATPLASVAAAGAKMASSRRSGKFTGLSRVKVAPPADRSGVSPEAPKVTSARTKLLRPETPSRAPRAVEASTTASPATTVPLISRSQPSIEPASAIPKPLPFSNLPPNQEPPVNPPALQPHPVFPNSAGGPFSQQTAGLPSLPGAFPSGDLYPFIGYTGEPDSEPVPNPPFKPPANPLADLAQLESKPFEGAPVFPVRQKNPTSPKLSISPPTEYVPWTEKALSPSGSVEPPPIVKLEIKPLPMDDSEGLQTSRSIAPVFRGEQTSGVNAPLDTAPGPPLDRDGASGSAFTPEGPKKSVQSRGTHSRTGSREMTSPASSEPHSPAHRRSFEEARGGVKTPHRSPRESFEGAAGFGSIPTPLGKDGDSRGDGFASTQRTGSKDETGSKHERKLAEGTWALGGAELAPFGVGNSEHTFSMWLAEGKKTPAAERRGARAFDRDAAPDRVSPQPVGETPSPGAVYRGPSRSPVATGRGPNDPGDSSPGPRLYGRTESDVSVRTSEFEGGVSSFAGSETSLDSPPRSPEPKLPEFHPPEKFAALFRGKTAPSGGSFTPPRGSPTRGSPRPGLPLPSGARPLPPVSKEPSFGDALKERRPLSPQLLAHQEGATREGSVPPDVQFWPGNGPPNDEFPTPPMPGRPSVPPPRRSSELSPTNPQHAYSPLVHPPGFQPAALVIPNHGFSQNGPKSQSSTSQSSTPSPALPPGYRTGLAEPYSGNPGVRNPGLGNPQLSFGSHSSGDHSQDSGYANPDLNRQDPYARSFESQSSGLGQGYVGAGGKGMQSQDSIRRKGLCSMCGQKSNKKVQCLVCNKKYCERCVGQAMGSMPEGRKCTGCVGLPIDEANRPHLGRSDSAIPGLPRERTSEILRAELVSVANLAGSERVGVNRKPLTREELAALMNAERPPPRMDRGDFWYDSRSGLWGKTGRPFERIVTAGLQVGGPLPQDASGGSTKVFINGRELGKRELRLFKFAGAKLKTKKRIWLDADGAYGEEGGPMKGNMWELKPLQLMLPLFGRPASEVETRLAKELQAEAASRVSKLLLVGPPETGKSTFARVVREMYGSGFSEEERTGDLRAMVLANVLHCARRLLEGRKEKFDDEEGEEDQWKYALEPENEPVAARALTTISTALGIAEMEKGKWLTLDYKLAGDLQRLWCDPGVQATFRVGGDISLPDSTDYFMDRLAEISAPGYVPSWDDVMASQVLHQVIPTGVTQVDFSIDDPEPSALSPTVPFSGNLSSIYELENAGAGAPFSAGNVVPLAVFRLLDPGPGHLANSPGWRRACEMFQDVSAVLFFVGLSDFDRFHSIGGEFHNRLEDARDLFESVINSPSFEGKPILLLFNKFDMFCRKLRANTSLTECDWLEDYDPGDHSTATDRFREDVEAQNAYTYIEKKFMALVEERNRRAPQVEVLVYKLSTVQQDSVDMVLQHLPDIVL